MRAASPKTGLCAPVEAPRFRVRFRLRLLQKMRPAARLGSILSEQGTHPLRICFRNPCGGFYGRTHRRWTLLFAFPARGCPPHPQYDRHLSVQPVSRVDGHRLDHRPPDGHLFEPLLRPPRLVLPSPAQTLVLNFETKRRRVAQRRPPPDLACQPARSLAFRTFRPLNRRNIFGRLTLVSVASSPVHPQETRKAASDRKLHLRVV